MQIDKEAIKNNVAAFLKVPAARIDEATPLNGIVPDSFMLVELLIQLQEDYGIRLSQADIEHIETIADLTHLILTRTQAVDQASASYA